MSRPPFHPPLGSPFPEGSVISAVDTADNVPIPPQILAAYNISPAGACFSCRPLGVGNINDTYLIKTPDRQFVLQRISSQVFPRPEMVVSNFCRVTSYLDDQIRKANLPFATPLPVLSRDGLAVVRDEQNRWWRAQTYLRGSVTGITPRLDRIGRALGSFHRLLADLPPDELDDPLPGFHNLPAYLKDYLEAEAKSPVITDCCETDFCRETIERFRHRAGVLEEGRAAGILPTQVIHGDPKADNFLFGRDGEVLALIDLDTVFGGIIHYDIGDCLRSCCNFGGEQGNDSVAFDLKAGSALLGGYFSMAGDDLTSRQRELFFDGLLLICYELGLRFFTDHLKGDVYFKVTRRGDNLLRAVRQFQLCLDVLSREAAIRSLLKP